MKKTLLTTLTLFGALQMHAQAFGDIFQSSGKYEITDTVYVTRYENGVPARSYTVTGDDKLRIMKAIGFIIDDYRTAEIPLTDPLLRKQPYSYMNSVAPLDKGTVYEIAPFYRYLRSPYRLFTGDAVHRRSHVGGILITGEKNDSTVIFGTVARGVEGRDSVFNYPLQYINGVPVEGKATLTQVQALRNLMKRMYRYSTGFSFFGTELQLPDTGDVRIVHRKKGIIVKQRTLPAVNVKPYLGNYLRTLYVDNTGRGYARSMVMPGGYKAGLTADDFTRDSYSAYHDIIKGDCIEIVYPSSLQQWNVKGFLIQINAGPARVYGLADDTVLGWPYLFYTDDTTTRRFARWFKHTVK